jgi:hypothetical protein
MFSMSNDDQLPSIDPSQLEAVTGGVTATDSTSTDMLMEMLPLMMMMRGQQAATAAPVVAAPPVGDGSGWIRVV